MYGIYGLLQRARPEWICAIAFFLIFGGIFLIRRFFEPGRAFYLSPYMAFFPGDLFICFYLYLGVSCLRQEKALPDWAGGTFQILWQIFAFTLFLFLVVYIWRSDTVKDPWFSLLSQRFHAVVIWFVVGGISLCLLPVVLLSPFSTKQVTALLSLLFWVGFGITDMLLGLPPTAKNPLVQWVLHWFQYLVLLVGNFFT